MSRMAFEYTQDKNGNIVLDEDIDTVLEVITEYINNKALSWREAADFVSLETGKYISHEGLRKVINRRKSDEG